MSSRNSQHTFFSQRTINIVIFNNTFFLQNLDSIYLPCCFMLSKHHLKGNSLCQILCNYSCNIIISTRYKQLLHIYNYNNIQYTLSTFPKLPFPRTLTNWKSLRVSFVPVSAGNSLTTSCCCCFTGAGTLGTEKVPLDTGEGEGLGALETTEERFCYKNNLHVTNTRHKLKNQCHLNLTILP